MLVETTEDRLIKDRSLSINTKTETTRQPLCDQVFTIIAQRVVINGIWIHHTLVYGYITALIISVSCFAFLDFHQLLIETYIAIQFLSFVSSIQKGLMFLFKSQLFSQDLAYGRLSIKGTKELERADPTFSPQDADLRSIQEFKELVL